ncbi:MAG: UDP-2,3-diacylglucosamine diphosphatase [Gemmatimonadota bacterium]|nr:UDP-2,3-diacylglucosamine diphosphatase [Gemmatimonadota bacterium]
MSEKPIYIASDIHLGVAPPETEQAFLRWLDHTAECASELILNGDIFDFWFEYRSVIPRGHTRVLGALADLVDRGVRVTIMAGNHDWWGGSFFSEEIGLTFLQDPVLRDLHGFQTFLAHGDGLGRGDVGYQLLRTLVRSRLTRWLFSWLHPNLGIAIAARVSQTEHSPGGPSKAEKGRSKILRKWAVGELQQNPTLDLIVCGHTHIPLLEEVEPGRYYANAGDWLRHRSYLVLHEGRPPVLHIWEE